MELRSQGPYILSQFLGGLAPAIFLFLTGVTMAFRMDSDERRGLAPGARVLSALMLGASEGIAERIGYAWGPTMERKRHANTLELLRERIGDRLVSEARAAGAALDLAQGIELALEGAGA